MRLSSIRFLAGFTDANDTDKVVDTQFKLGPGPFGKTVVNLSCDPLEAQDVGFAVIQTHSDGSVKVFTYLWRQLRGRMEVDIEA